MMTRFRIGIQTRDGQWRPNIASVLTVEGTVAIVQALINCRDDTHARIIVEIAREDMEAVEASMPPEPPPT